MTTPCRAKICARSLNFGSIPKQFPGGRFGAFPARGREPSQSMSPHGLHLSKTLAVNEKFKIYHPRGLHLSKTLAVNETFKINHPHGFHLSKTLAVNKNFEIYHSHGLHLSKTHAVNENFFNLPTSWDPFVENPRCER